MGCSNEPPESLPPISMVESDKNKDIVEDASTLKENEWRRKGNVSQKAQKQEAEKARKQKEILRMNSDPKSNVQSI